MSKRVVITIHGIRTFGQWQERLQRLLKDADPEIEVENYHYGYFSVIAFLIPLFRWWATRIFRREFLRIVAKYPNYQICVVAHSFGTHLLGWGLRGASEERRPRIDTIVLAGSVLRSSFPWGELLDRGNVRRLINDCGISDNILLLSQMFVLLTGMAGRVGFTGMSSERFLNRYFTGGHSHYFLDAGRPDDKFMALYWVPVLAGLKDPVLVDQRQAKGPLQGVELTLLQIADPLKLAAYLSLIVGLVYFGYLAPREREAAARERARIEQVRRLGSAATQSGISASAVNQLARAHTLDLGNAFPQYRETLAYWLMYLVDVRELINRVPDLSTFNWGDNTYARVGARVVVVPGDRKLKAWISGGGTAVYGLDPGGRLHSYRLPDGVETASIDLPITLYLSLYELVGGKVIAIRGATGAVQEGLILWGVKSGEVETLPAMRRGYEYGDALRSAYANKSCSDFAALEEDNFRVVHVAPDGTLQKELRKDDLGETELMPRGFMSIDEACARNKVADPKPEIREEKQQGAVYFAEEGGEEGGQPWIRFPLSVPEETLWIRAGVQGPRPKDGQASLLSDRGARLRAATLTDQKRLAELIGIYLKRADAKDQGVDSERANYLYALRLEHDDISHGDTALGFTNAPSILDLDGDMISYRSGDAGAQHGKYSICKVPRNGGDLVCVFVRYAGDYGHLAQFSSDSSYFVSSNDSWTEGRSFDLVDLRGMRLVTPKRQPVGTILAAAFSESGDRLAVLSAQGEIYLYALGSEVSLISHSTASGDVSQFAQQSGEFSRLCSLFWGQVLVYCTPSGFLTAVDTETWNTLWRVEALVPPGEPRDVDVFWKKRSTVATVFDKTKVKLIRLSDGVGLSEWLLVSKLQASEKSVLSDVGFLGDGRPIIRLGAEWFVRERPLSEEAVSQVLSRLECYTGLEKGESQKQGEKLPCD